FSNVPADPAFPANGVMVKATGITTSQTVINLKPGETLQLNAAVLPANTTHNKVYWYAEDEDEVSVDSNGLVSARSGGTTTIRAAADGQMATVTVTISGSS
ncbi:MAG: Ig-like domain-containing protein, partial [Treponema sp.]|nr:Ig-like domain-containing protein [Treponema sp.]